MMAEVSKIGANGIEYDVADETARADIATLTENLASTDANLATTNSNLATTNSNLATTNSNLAQTQSDLDAAEGAIAAINKIRKGTASGTTTGGGQLYLSAATYPNLIAAVCTNAYANGKAVSAAIHGKSGTSWILVFRDQNGDIFAGQTAQYDYYYI